MAASYPPSPPTPPPPRSNDTLLAVVIGVVVVLGLMVSFGVYTVRHFIEDTHISDVRNGTQHTVEIHSPLGDLKVDGDGDNAKVDINSPFGSVKVVPTPDLDHLDISIYPGAELVKSAADSPFHRDHQFDGFDGLDNLDDMNNVRVGDSTGAQVRLASGPAALDVDVAEFRTPASPAQVLNYYATQLGRLGTVTRHHHGDGATTLELKLSNRNVRAAAIRPGSDGTHFVLVRVLGGDTSK